MTDKHAAGKREEISIGLYDSATGESLDTIKVVDVSDKQHSSKVAMLVYGEAKRGRIAQLCSDSMRIHWFFDEPEGRKMIDEDSNRFGFRNRLLRLIVEHAPPSLKAGPSHVEK